MIILDRLSKAQSSSQGTRLYKDGTHVSLDCNRYRTGNVKAVGYILTVNYGGNKPGDLCVTRPGREMATGSIGRFYVQLVLITITSSVCPYLPSPLLSFTSVNDCVRACEETLVVHRGSFTFLHHVLSKHEYGQSGFVYVLYYSRILLFYI